MSKNKTKKVVSIKEMSEDKLTLEIVNNKKELFHMGVALITGSSGLVCS